MQQEASLKRTYLRQVKKHLTCSPKERNRFLHRTEQMLDAFLEENPDATEEDLYLALGSPEELAEQMMEECEFHSTPHSNKFIEVSIVLSLALICASIMAYLYFRTNPKIEVNPIQYVYTTDCPDASPFSSLSKLN